MKQQVSPAVAAIVVVVIVGIAAFAWFRFAGPRTSSEQPKAMPDDVAKEWNKWTKGQGGSPTGGAGGSSIPSAGGR